jgi:hypothetical protein
MLTTNINGKSIYFTQISQDEFASWLENFTLLVRKNQGKWIAQWCGIRGDAAMTEEEALENFKVKYAVSRR